MKICPQRQPHALIFSRCGLCCFMGGPSCEEHLTYREPLMLSHRYNQLWLGQTNVSILVLPVLLIIPETNRELGVVLVRKAVQMEGQWSD